MAPNKDSFVILAISFVTFLHCSNAKEGVSKLGCSPCVLAVGIGRSQFEATSLMMEAMAKGNFNRQSDFEKKIVVPIKTFLVDAERQYFVKIKEYRGLCHLLHIFLERYFIKLPNSTPLSKTWVDMFKKAGAYYTMENLVKYSGLKLMNYETDELLNRDDSLKYLEECKSQGGYQLLALLKRSLEVNDFKFSEVI